MPRDIMHIDGLTVKVTAKQIEFLDHKTGKRTRWRYRTHIIPTREPIIYRKGDVTFTFLGAGKIEDIPDEIVLMGKVAEPLGKTMEA